MDKSGGKRKRSANFSELDHTILMTLVAEKKEIVENKKTDYNTVVIKNTAWEDICHKFNAMTTGEARSTKELRDKHHNLKQVWRKKKTEDQRPEGFKNEDSSSHNSLNSLERLHTSALTDDGINDISNPFDNDMINQYVDSQNAKTEEFFEVVVKNEVQNEAESDESRHVSDEVNSLETLRPQQCANELFTQKMQVMSNLHNKDDIERQIQEAKLTLLRKQIELCDKQKELCLLQIKEIKSKTKN